MPYHNLWQLRNEFKRPLNQKKNYEIEDEKKSVEKLNEMEFK